MRGRKKLSPFEQLMRYIEQMQMELSFELQQNPRSVNPDFDMGYTAALNQIYSMGIVFYNRGAVSPDIVIGADFFDTDLIQKLKIWD